MTRAFWIAVALCLGNHSVGAEPPAAAQATFVDLVAAQKALRQDIKAGKQTFSPDQRDQLYKAQDELFALADENPTDADLSEEEWVKAFNAQERIHQIISEAADDERVVCRREKPTGSNRKQSICHTVAQWRGMQTNQADMVRMSREGSTG
ncbi:MAG: hypothetical protein JNL89_19175, partial [Rhodanobacteraceae bacterium]|nr:hypothetical protein [Rhodanobacteraceae bacterium]